ncbi:MAG: type II toxin-antitoxin system VapC family toxin [Actinobacteria bacterium]|nr:type II toxin-antitoxin system VapC family toxin [Actinomycetota bacterium]
MSEGAPLLLDTSAAVALVVADHVSHDDTVRAAGNYRLGLAGHAWFETFSVLTRLPPPARRAPRDVLRLLSADFPATRFLTPGATERLVDALADLGMAGGQVYDALIGAVCVEHDAPLLSRDRRAVEVYGALGVRCELLG